MKKKAIHSLVVVAFAIFSLQSLSAGNFQKLSTGCLARCPSCQHTCRAVPVTYNIKKSAYEISYKQICIPAITFPWQKCCEPRCGKVITVKKLHKVSYECERCGCKWKIEPCGCSSYTSSLNTVEKVKVRRGN